MVNSRPAASGRWRWRSAGLAASAALAGSAAAVATTPTAAPRTSSGQYNNNGTVGSAVISVDPVTHNIVVIADKETSEQIRQVIASLDAPEPQVLIKVVFVEVEDNTASDIGVQGSYTGFNWNFSQITGFMTNSYILSTRLLPPQMTVTHANVHPQHYPSQPDVEREQQLWFAPVPGGAAGNGGIYQFMGNDFTATLQAIATAGKAQVLSRPSILARDGQMAEIVVGQSIYLPSGVSFSAVGGSATTVPTINGSYQNVGIQLDVTPFIGANNLVQMILEPQITSIDTSTPGQVIEGGSLIHVRRVCAQSSTNVPPTPWS